MSRKILTKEEMLAELDTLDLPEVTIETFRRVINTVEENLTESERRDYEVDLEKYIKTMGMIRTGREEGREEGRLEGLEEGRAQGRAEQQKATAKAMRAKGIDVQTIADCTQLSVEEIEAM